MYSVLAMSVMLGAISLPLIAQVADTNKATTSAKAKSLVGPPAASVDAAIAAPLTRYNRHLKGGAHTNMGANGGAPVVLALAAMSGDARADARLLEQMRYTLTGGNDITANGGYPAQHERNATAMFALSKRTPRIWNQLSVAEKARVDLLMKAALVQR
jgi:hypothetical protein